MKKDMQEKVKEITEQLEQGVAELFTSEKFMAYLQAMSKFHNYSLNNSLLIWMQMPEATLVAGYKDWQRKFKRQVRNGETSIKILAPIPKKYRKEVVLDDGTTEEREISYMRYRAVSVFDISQTDGDDLPEICRSLDGDVDGYQGLVDKLKEISPVPVDFEDIAGTANGFYHLADKRIVVQQGMSQSQTIKTMVHEIAHSILHDKDSGIEKEADRRTREVQAEAVAYTVNQYLGLDTSDYSFGYIVGWSSGKETKELKESLAAIRNTAHDIIEKIA